MNVSARPVVAISSAVRLPDAGTFCARKQLAGTPLYSNSKLNRNFIGPKSRTLRDRRRHRCTPSASIGVPITMAQLAPYAPSFLGGLTIGTVVLGKFILSGRILGISGTVKGLVKGDLSPWRLLFLAGFFSASAALTAIYPAIFEAMPVSAGIMPFIIAGSMVGFGTGLGNGCTSGHGICGISRLSLRSFASTVTFMVFGAIAASFTEISPLLGLVPGFVVSSTPAPELLSLAKTVLANAIALVMAVATASKLMKIDQRTYMVPSTTGVALERFFEFASGALMALGLGVSGMVRPSKVLGFLGVFSGTFDPSLLFVMGGALIIALPGYQYVLRSGAVKQPLCANDVFDGPKNKAIDLPLIVGAAIFGAGWGTAGVCPGPLLVGLATLQMPFLAFAGAMVGGMLVSVQVEGLLSGTGSGAAAKTV